MGIYNRDYYRSEGSSGGIPGLSSSTMVQKLLIITIAAFILQIILTVPRYYTLDELIEHLPGDNRRELVEVKERNDPQEIRRITRQFGPVYYDDLLSVWGRLDREKVAQGQIWRLVTYAFLHDRGWIWHLVFNMVVLWSFGSAIEELIGRREFLMFYLCGAIFSGVCHILFCMAIHSNSTAVGASGALMGVAMLFAIYYPTAPIYVYFISVEARWLIVLYLVFDSYPVLMGLSGHGNRDGIAHAAHLGGLGFGFLYYKMHWRLTDWLPRRGGPSWGQQFVKWWNRPQVRVYRPPVERPMDDRPIERPSASSRTINSRDMERRVDEILKKIKDQGEASLTEEERNMLRDASQAYKKKNS